jgi:hypothetical protein
MLGGELAEVVLAVRREVAVAGRRMAVLEPEPELAIQLALRDVDADWPDLVAAADRLAALRDVDRGGLADERARAPVALDGDDPRHRVAPTPAVDLLRIEAGVDRRHRDRKRSTSVLALVLASGQLVELGAGRVGHRVHVDDPVVDRPRLLRLRPADHLVDQPILLDVDAGGEEPDASRDGADRVVLAAVEESLPVRRLAALFPCLAEGEVDERLELHRAAALRGQELGGDLAPTRIGRERVGGPEVE